jgi:hypothetical protein
MDSRSTSTSGLSLVPLGPGDLIDRALRFYRRNFVTFILIAAPPVVVGTLFTVGWAFLSRSIFPYGATSDPIDLTVYYILAWFGTTIIWFVETVATLAVMGGASRNFVRHLLYGEPITFAETYRNTWSRIGGLIVASAVITMILGFLGGALLYFGLIAGGLLAMLVYWAFSLIEPLAGLLAIVISVASFLGIGTLFFLIASRFAYVPQVMLVEGLGVFSAIGRSLSLAKGNVKRFAALFIFTLVATYSALAILYVPLGWYAWIEGVEIFGIEAEMAPTWFRIASQLVWQASIVLLSPIWMVGLCLLYVDERVRHEGYDIEIMAARELGEMPDVPQAYANPLQPAIAGSKTEKAGSGSGFTGLGLK